MKSHDTKETKDIRASRIMDDDDDYIEMPLSLTPIITNNRICRRYKCSHYKQGKCINGITIYVDCEGVCLNYEFKMPNYVKFLEDKKKNRA